MFARKIWQPLGKLALSRAIIESNRPSKFAIHGLACSTEAPYMAPSRGGVRPDRKSTRLNSSHSQISYAAFCFKKKSVVARLGEYGRPLWSTHSPGCSWPSAALYDVRSDRPLGKSCPRCAARRTAAVPQPHDGP